MEGSLRVNTGRLHWPPPLQPGPSAPT